METKPFTEINRARRFARFPVRLLTIPALLLSATAFGKAADEPMHDAADKKLAEKCCPIIKTNAKGTYRPVQLQEVCTGLVLEQDGMRIIDAKGIAAFGAFADWLVNHLAVDTSKMKIWSKEFNWEDGEPAETPEGKPACTPNLFWRVRALDENLKVLSYFWFCTFSDADFPANAGDHDGDWLCVSLTLSRKDDHVKKVLFHHHGDSSEFSKEQCEWNGNRLVILAEHNSNEPHPKPVGDDLLKGQREATGKGAVIADWAMIDVYGGSAEANAFMLFKGRWGTDHGPGTDLPTSPRWQEKMWNGAAK